MAGPWEDYAKPATTAGPWEDYAAAKTDAPMTAEGARKALDVGLQEGVAGLASLPRTVGTLGAQGIQGAANWVSRKLGLPEDTRNLETQKGAVELPTYESALATIQDPKGMFRGEAYTPQNTGEEYLRTLGQFAPNVALGGGGVVRSVIAPALASETAGQLTKGYGAEPYARLAGAVLGAGAATNVGNTARMARGYRGAPTLPETGTGVDTGYTAARSAGVELNPTYISKGLDRIANGLTSGVDARDPGLIQKTLGLLTRQSEKLAPEQPGAMAAITKVTPAAKGPVDFNKLDALRRDLGEIARDFTNPTEQAVARTAQRQIDDLLENAAKIPGAVQKGDGALLAQTAREARANAAMEFRLKAMEALKTRAEDIAASQYSGRNFENVSRQQYRSFIRPDLKGVSPAQREGLTPQEIAMIRREGTRVATFPNALRLAGNALGGGGGIATGGLGAAGYLSGDPRFYAAAGLGFGARNLSNALARSRANYLTRMIASRSPLAQQMGVVPGPPPVSAAGPAIGGGLMGMMGGGAAAPQYFQQQLPAGLTQADVDQALNGPGWENIRGTPEHRLRQTPVLPRVNPAAWEAFLANAPRSRNIEDRRRP